MEHTGGWLRVRFLGTGEAFDERRVNVSLLVEGRRRLLVDCGPTVPWALWRWLPEPDALDALYVSHFHGDHLFGVPFLLTRWQTDGRTRPFTVFGQRGTLDRIEQVTRLAYRNVWDKLPFSLGFREVEPDLPVTWEGWTFRTAESHHSQRNLALRLEAEGIALCYSGDGAPTAATRALYRGCDVLVHECYAETRVSEHHAMLPEVLTLARDVGARSVALVHLARALASGVDAALAGSPSPADPGHPAVLVPQPGDELPRSALRAPGS
jgi:ribonuclease BN (tRNA processing enzyme)